MRGLSSATSRKEGEMDPLRCPHVTERGVIEGKVYCGLHDAWVECQESHWGEPPRCAWDEPDNSDEAKARRVAWVRENG